MERLAHRRAFVTGGSSGIGAATVRRLVAEGARVVFTARHRARAAAVAEETGTSFLIADSRDPASITASVAAAADRLGGLDIVVPNAGVLHAATIDDTDDEAWAGLIETNLLAPFRTVRAALPHLAESRCAAVVLLGSDAGIWGETAIAAYSVTKRAVHMLTRMLAAELGPDGIRVNAVCPGDTAPGMVTVVDGRDELPDVSSWTKPPLGFSVHADEIAAAIAHLASDDARSTNGAELLIDGGMRAALRANTIWASR